MEKTLRLEGLNVVLFEARHAKTIAELVAKQGGSPFSAPAMKEVPLADNPEAFRFVEKLFRGEVDVMILLTGVGTRFLVDVLQTKYPREKILEAYKQTTLIPRGPKPIRVLNEWKIPYALTVPEPNTWREVLKALDEHPVQLKNKTVVVQEYGVPNPELVQGLEQRGARVLRVPVYRWALPDDLGPLKEAVRRILAGNVDVAVFTTAVQIKHVLEVAEMERKKDALLSAFKKIVVASVGPDCSGSLRSHGVGPDIEPESPKMGPLVLALAEKAASVLERKKK